MRLGTDLHLHGTQLVVGTAYAGHGRLIAGPQDRWTSGSLDLGGRAHGGQALKQHVGASPEELLRDRTTERVGIVLGAGGLGSNGAGPVRMSDEALEPQAPAEGKPERAHR